MNAKVISITNPKGGTGKTTTALIVAEQIHKAGAKIVMLDVDPNQNLINWKLQREKTQKPIPFEIEPRPKEEDILDVIDEIKKRADYLLIDFEGTAGQIVTFGLSKTDLAIIPFEPTPMEARQAARAVKLIRNTSKMINKEIKYTLALTRTNAAFQTSDEKDVRKNTDQNNINILNVSLVRRAAYTRIFRENCLLSELDKEKVSNVSGAIENANAFSQAIVNMLQENTGE